ncbi:hypothetical protein MNB_ARC-1_248 [hydrothermal vent metagenome]|uniref:Uncharacterized protein n=1 Tax=hydrothermal vent metagenome TaxID=652676 RepID=A0A3B1E6X2_9ZZZZ
MDFLPVSIFTHVVTICCLLAVMIFNIYSVVNINNFVTLAKRLRLMTPIYHGLNFTLAYMGTIVAAYTHQFNTTILIMIIATIVTMILEIKRYKKMRIITSTDIQRQKEFIPYARNIYIIEICVIIFTSIISILF